MKVFGTGRLTKDIELKKVGDTSVATFDIACDGHKRETTNFFTIDAWGVLAENCAKYLSKGSQIVVDGTLETSTYETKDGVKRTKTKIYANQIEFVGAKSNTAHKSNDGVKKPIDVSDEDMPF